ncbi:MAG: ScyD/ScyE family protein [Acidimicrobiia bacterium]|nr:ScyD/ScyE family protein [Acidimicrobiia bacterium]
MSIRFSKRAATALIAFLLVLMAAVPAAAKPKSTTNDPLATGLVGPLGLAVGDDGTVYVTEAFAGRLTAIDKNGSTKVLLDAPGTEIAGVDAKGKGTLVFTQTVFDGAPGEEAPVLDALLARLRPNGKVKAVASTNDYEAAVNPDSGSLYGLVDLSGAADAASCNANWPTEFLGPQTYTGIVESHPYAVAIVPGGHVVADAAANAIFHIKANGDISTLAVLPPIPQEITQELADSIDFADLSGCVGGFYYGEPVPTDIEVGPDGHYYVSTLPGGPEAPGAGAVWKVNPANGAVTLVSAGLTTPVDIAVADDGTIWVAELFGFQISTIKNGTVAPEMFAPLPGAIEIGPDGTIFAVINALPPEDGPPDGQVVRISP